MALRRPGGRGPVACGGARWRPLAAGSQRAAAPTPAGRVALGVPRAAPRGHAAARWREARAGTRAGTRAAASRSAARGAAGAAKPVRISVEPAPLPVRAVARSRRGGGRRANRSPVPAPTELAAPVRGVPGAAERAGPEGVSPPVRGAGPLPTKAAAPGPVRFAAPPAASGPGAAAVGAEGGVRPLRRSRRPPRVPVVAATTCLSPSRNGRPECRRPPAPDPCPGRARRRTADPTTRPRWRCASPPAGSCPYCRPQGPYENGASGKRSPPGDPTFTELTPGEPSFGRRRSPRRKSTALGGCWGCRGATLAE